MKGYRAAFLAAILAMPISGSVNAQADPPAECQVDTFFSEIKYDDYGRVIEILTYDGRIESLVYDNAGRMISRDDGVGGRTRYGYDEAGRVTSITRPEGVTLTEYDSTGRPATIKHADGSVTQYEYRYDEAGRVKSTLKNTGDDWIWVENDGDGNLLRATGPLSEAEWKGVCEVLFGDDPGPPAGCDVGGNPNLEVETSHTYTVAFVAQPNSLPGLNITLDYYHIEISEFFDPFPVSDLADDDPGPPSGSNFGGNPNLEGETGDSVSVFEAPPIYGLPPLSITPFDINIDMFVPAPDPVFVEPDWIGIGSSVGLPDTFLEPWFLDSDLHPALEDFENVNPEFLPPGSDPVTVESEDPPGSQVETTAPLSEAEWKALGEVLQDIFKPDPVIRDISVRTDYTYDQNGLVSEYREHYIAAGDPISVVKVSDRLETRYDARGRAIAFTELTDTLSTVSYDSLGRVTSVGPVTETTTVSESKYDQYGRVVECREATAISGSSVTETTFVSEIRYDQFGRVVEFRGVTERAATQYTWGESGNLESSIDPSGSLTEYSYNADDNLTEINQIDRKVTQIQYNDLGQEISRVEFVTTNLQPILVGSRKDVGTEDTATKAVKGVAKKLFGSLLGGGGGGGSGGSEPKTERDPTRKGKVAETPMTDAATGVAIWVRPRWTKTGDLLISTQIVDSPDKGTFHAIYLEDEYGRQMGPSKIEIYKIWRKHTLTVSWTRSTYVDGALVSQTSGGWTESWTEDLGYFQRTSDGGEVEGPPPLWRLAGFDRAHAGVRRLGTYFAVTMEQLQEMGTLKLVVHITQPGQDPVMTVPLAYYISQGESGVPQFTPIDNSLTAQR